MARRDGVDHGQRRAARITHPQVVEDEEACAHPRAFAIGGLDKEDDLLCVVGNLHQLSAVSVEESGMTADPGIRPEPDHSPPPGEPSISMPKLAHSNQRRTSVSTKPSSR